MDFVKHECGIAMVRLLKDIEHYEQRYGDAYYGLHLLEKLLIREYNRGQDGAGVGCVAGNKENAQIYVLRQEGTSAVEKIEERVNNEIAFERDWGSEKKPFYGSQMIGHVRYSTTGLIGTEYLHPFIYENEKNGESVMICGNFHLINTPALINELYTKGKIFNTDCDTEVLLNHIAQAHWDEEGNRISTENTLEKVAPKWDGGFVICGIDTVGEWWVIRDSHGIRPAFWYADEEKVIVASEKSAIKLCAGARSEDIHDLHPGVMLKVDSHGKLSFRRIIEEKPIRECVFERIYFSRADGEEITYEREKLGYLLAKRIREKMSLKTDDTFFSFVPASARSSFLGMVAFFAGLKIPVVPQVMIGDSAKKHEVHTLENKKEDTKVFFGRTIEKGGALRTFISTEKGREELVEKTYIKVLEALPENIKKLVIVDDSIVRGTTLKSSVIVKLDSYGLEEIIVVSCSPQVRYPDFYGIDMSRLGELIAFRAAVNILKRQGKELVLTEVYDQCVLSLSGKQRTKNFVRLIYSQTSEEEIAEEVARLVTPEYCNARVKIIYLSMEDLREAIPNHTGDWCFSGNYPTSGAYTKICQAYVNWYEGVNKR